MSSRFAWWTLAVVLTAGCGGPPARQGDDAGTTRAPGGWPRPIDDAPGLEWVAANGSYLTHVADTIWASPETAHDEFQTAALLERELVSGGFSVQRGVADLPTSVVASYGAGRPVIGIVALLDALPGLSQTALALTRQPLAPDGAGHGCGHHLICAADLGAVLAVRRELEARALPGTIVFVGAPAEEIYHGGVYMVRAGVFDEMDAILFWHPSTVTMAIGRSGLAMRSVRYRFSGRPSDATDAAALGIDGLASVEQLVRDVAAMEWPDGSVVNHVISDGGRIPSVVPESAEAWYFVHAPTLPLVDAIGERIDEAARRATANGATLDVRVLSSTRHWLINSRLTSVLHHQLEQDPPMAYTDADRTLARALQESFGREANPFAEGVLPLDFSDVPVPISDDTAEASWVRPRGGFLVASFPAGIASHTWQWTALGTSGPAHQGMLKAARTLVSTAIQLLTDPDLRREIEAEFSASTAGAPYVSPIPAGQGPFDYLVRPDPPARETNP